MLLLFTMISVQGQTIKPFKNQDRVVFIGNSITDGGHYHSYIWLYYLTHFPKRHIKVYNAGIGGDVAAQMYARLDSDVFAKKPSVLTLTFGMNDTGYQNLKGSAADSVYQSKISTSLKSYQLITAELKKHPEIQKIMIASSPYDETTRIKATPLYGKNKAMLQIADEQLKVSRQNNWGYVDFNRPMTAINTREQQRDSTFTMEGFDRIHPTNDGHMVMAYLFLKAQGLAGQKVAAIMINTALKRTVKAENCQITALSVSPGRLSFNYLARALPYPIDTIPHGANSVTRSQADGLKLIPFVKDFDQETLQISGLKAGSDYTLTIDDKPMGAWSGADLNKGINLAVIVNTPQYQQALAVMHLNEERWEIERRLREYYWLQYSILKPHGLLYNDGPATLDSLKQYAKKDFFVAVTLPTYYKARFNVVRQTWLKEIELLTTQLYTINQPKRHRFKLTLVN